MIQNAWRIASNAKIVTGSLIAGLICIAISQVPIVEAASVKPSGDISKVRLGGNITQTRMVIDLEKSVKGDLVSSETQSDRAVLKLSGIKASNQSGQGRGLVSNWRIDNFAGQTRLSLDFQKNASVSKRFLLPPSDGIDHYRYVIDIVPKSISNIDAKPVKSVAPVSGAVMAAALDDTKDAKPRSRKRIVVIDAGHGGHDPGASGVYSKEKDVNLAAAKTLKATLEATGRYRVIMTRDTDAYVDKVARVRIARSANADLFISLHADSGPSHETRGASVYTLSDSGAERAARKAMARGDWALPMQPVDKVVNRILVDLTQRATKNRSATFAELMVNKLEGTTPLLKTSHRQAGFVVLLATDVPAVLLEMGFMTNTQDEKLLNDSAQRNRMMLQVSKAIDHYFENDVAYASFAMLP
jgi:N-acetylmuramoyl-L-alanine amidase